MLFSSIQMSFAESLYHTCQTDSARCAELSQAKLVDLTPNTLPWYDIKLLQLESLFLLDKTDLLLDALTATTPIPTDAPQEFNLKVYVYFAKVYLKERQLNLSEQYAKLASDIFRDMLTRAPQPSVYLDFSNLLTLEYHIANAQNNEQKAQLKLSEAIKNLLALEKASQASNDPIFYRELYGNLGHVYMFDGNFNNALKAYDSSLFWTKQGQSEQQLAVAEFNVGKALKALQRYESAMRHFEQASMHAFLSQDMNTYVTAQLNMAVCNVQLTDIDKASSILSNVEDFKFTATQKKLFESIQADVQRK